MSSKTDLIVRFIQENPGRIGVEIAEALGVNRTHISYVLRRNPELRNLVACGKNRPKNNNPEIVEAYVRNNPGMTPKEISSSLGISVSAIRRILREYELSEYTEHRPRPPREQQLLDDDWYWDDLPEKKKNKALPKRHVPLYYGRPYGGGVVTPYTQLM